MNISIRTMDDDIREIDVVSAQGQRVSLLSVGAALTSWRTDSGIDIVAAYQNVTDYRKGGMYLGTTVGPIAGRVENGVFAIGGKTYRSPENPPHFLHGGIDSIAFRNFADEIEKNGPEEAVVRFTHRFRHHLIPGTIDVSIRYVIRHGMIRIVYDATSDEPTVSNFTNHSYFNLDGDFARDLSNHELLIKADRVVLVDDDILGRTIAPVKGTPFDFTTKKAIMPSVLEIKGTGHASRGIDHYYLFEPGAKAPQVELTSLKTGLTLSVSTTTPGVTVYTGNYPKENPLRSGGTLAQHGSICFETQFQSNAMNDPRFVPALVSPERPWHQETTFSLGGM
ncbi:MAG: hypothetical protein WC509_00895 [Candidatus Izemoplasmatales bacterium]